MHLITLLGILAICYGSSNNVAAAAAAATVADDDNDDCVSRSPCSCVYSDGTGYDLSQLAVGKQNVLESLPFGNKIYLFHPCDDTTDVPDYIKNNTEKYSIGVYDKNSTSFSVLGKSGKSLIQTNSDTRTYLIYKQEKDITTVRLVCVNINEDHLYVYTNKADTNDTHVADLVLYSRHGCRIKIEDHHGMSAASLLFLTFFIIAFGYLFIGIALKYYLVGARGIEVIPNISFWRRVPSKLMDGIDYVRGGCRPRSENLTSSSSPNPDSYISI